MKKFISILLCICLMFAVSATVAIAAVNGDVNADNTVNAADARCILRAAVGLDTLTGNDELAADLDLDSKITASDARTALRIAVGLDTVLPGKFYQNEYDVIRSNHYIASFTHASTEDSPAKVIMAITEDATMFKTEDFDVSALLGTSIKNMTMNISIYATPNGMYLCDNNKKSYANLAAAEELLREMGETSDTSMFSANEFINVGSSFESFPDLSEATSTQSVRFNGTSCTAYVFDTGSTVVKVYMAQRKLLGIQCFNSAGTVVDSYTFDYVSMYVSVSDVSLPQSYTENSDFVGFLLESFGQALLGLN